MPDVLELFSDAAQAWFRNTFEAPTEVQARGWAAIANGSHSLLCAPTGSGKTLAAFFWCLDRLHSGPTVEEPARCRVLYVSPLKALAFDVDRNLRGPLAGLNIEAQRRGIEPAHIRVGVRTGDTPSEDRRQMQRHPPDILITTPESLFLMLTSAARSILEPVRWVIVDEIHTMAASKRGAHLAVSLERLCARTAVEPRRIGLSATQKPLEEVGRYLGGRGREVEIVDAGHRKVLELSIELPALQQSDGFDDGESLRSGPAATLGTGQSNGYVGITTEIAHARPWASNEVNGDNEQPSPASTPSRSLWTAIYPRILELIRAHRSTIVFVNSRRMAERLAAKLNELAGEELVRAHHGSIAREQRMLIEDLLKAGKLPALVATSSLELGIDMGAVELVIQVGSPTSVARGIQRVGRAGHSVGSPSVGTIFPTHRGDLLESAAVVERMLAGDIETTRVPRNPLDVLAQQIVAMCALDQWQLDDVRALITRAYPFSDLGDRALTATLDMLDGRYPSHEFAELRPRIVWDRMAGTLRGRQGAQRLAVTSGGTIPDRGLYTVNLFDDGKRVGELDEEMVYETRPGETFVLGATTWKAVEITQSQVRVVPAPGEPGKLTFWHGDALGRPVELGRAVGQLTRALLKIDEEEAISQLERRAGCDPSAARMLLDYLKDQQEATTAVPDDRTVVVETFRDQLGDWRVCVLTPFGSRVHAPWVLAAQARLQERFGLEIQSIYSDDGFALRLIDADTAPLSDELLIDPDEVRDAVSEQLHGSALFASRFRENAARALLLPRLRPGSRTPLWLQRQKSADLLKVASRYPDFPILAETYRECLTDVFDLEALRDLMRRIRAREVRVVQVETAQPSPFSASLLFDYIAQYMYEGDQPLAERRAQALTLDKELLAELLGDEDLRDLLDPRVIEETEQELQGLEVDRQPRNLDEAHDLLRRIGDLTALELCARGVTEEWLQQLATQGRVIPIRVAGEERWIAADDGGLYRDGLGVSLPLGLPEAFVQTVDNPLEDLVLRWARSHVPFVPSEPAARWDIPTGYVSTVLHGHVSRGDIVIGHFRLQIHEQEFCSQDVLRRLRRRSLAALRRDIEPVQPVVLSRFQPGWQGVNFQARGLERLADVIAQLQGYPIPISVLERDVLPIRMSNYTPQLLDQLIGSGEVIWIGRGALGQTDGRIALYLRKDAPMLFEIKAQSSSAGKAGASGEDASVEDRRALHTRLRERLSRGACFYADLLGAAQSRDGEEVLDALWDLVWMGEVTNDLFSPLRFVGPSRRGGRLATTRLGPPRSQGRWSLVTDSLEKSVAPTQRLHAQCEQLLQRYGILTREHVLSEGLTGGFVGIYPILKSMEEAGRIRRGYFVEGLGGAQFALPGAVDRLRSRPSQELDVVALAATDPASAYGVTMPWPQLNGRPARAAGAYVILEGGELRVFLERGGRSLLTNGQVELEHVSELKAIASRRGKLEITAVDGVDVSESELRPLLIESGFAPTHRGLVRYPERRQSEAHLKSA